MDFYSVASSRPFTHGQISWKGKKHTTVLATTIAHDLAILRFCKVLIWFTFACIREGLLTALWNARYMQMYILRVTTMSKSTVILVISRATCNHQELLLDPPISALSFWCYQRINEEYANNAHCSAHIGLQVT